MEELLLGDSLEALIDHRGRTPKKLGTDFTDSGVPVISAKLVDNGSIDFGSARFVDVDTWKRWMPTPLQRNDVVLTSEAPLGRTAQIRTNAPVVLGQRLFALRGAVGVLDSTFLRYWLESPRGQASLASMASGTTVVGIRQELLLKVKIPAPSFKKQRTIGAVLGSLDDKIAANEKTIRASTALAESLVAGSLLDKESKLGDIAAITMGTSPKGEFLSEEQLDLPFYQGVRDFGFLRPNHRIFTDHPVREADTGDILFAVRAPVGEVNIATERTAIGRGLAAIRGIENHVALFYLLRSRPDLWNSHQDSGTVFASINKTDLAAALVPSIAMSETEERSLRVLHEHSLATVEENRVLAKTRDELLPLLMNGKISVREAEQEATSAGADIPSEDIGA